MTDIPKLSPFQPQTTLLDLQERIAQRRDASSGPDAGKDAGQEPSASTIVSTGGGGLLAGGIASLAEALDLSADEIGEAEATSLASALRSLLDGETGGLTSPAAQALLRNM